MDLQVYSDGWDYWYGGNRIHIYDWDRGKCLCGTKMIGSCTLVDVTPQWLEENKNAEGLCKKCEKIARKLLSNDKQEMP